MPCKKKQGSTPSFSKLKRRMVDPTRFQNQSMHASWRLTRKRVEPCLPKDHEDHIAGKVHNSMTRYNLVHTYLPMPQAMKILEAKAAVDKEWKKARNDSSLAVGQSPD